MSAIAKVVMQKFNRQAAGQPEKLLWHRDEPDALLRSAVEARGGSYASCIDDHQSRVWII